MEHQQKIKQINLSSYRIMAAMYQGIGQHKKAISFLDEAIAHPNNDHVSNNT